MPKNVVTLPDPPMILLKAKPDPRQLAAGIKVEMEHADTAAWAKKHPNATMKQIAEQIARDHLAEDSNYYTKLKRMEAKKSLLDLPVVLLKAKQRNSK